MAEQAGLSLIWSKTPEDRFSRDEAHIIKVKPQLLSRNKFYGKYYLSLVTGNLFSVFATRVDSACSATETS